ncbi:MAG: hypothetical protein IT438_10235 [Phycisphaerales bacterium]|nr:hypothetical protein [Phycisphaerales bacterium]
MASVLNAVDVQSLQVFETGLVVVLSTIIGHVAISLYFRAMAVRIRDSEMVRAATSLIWLPAVVVVAGFVLANILGTLVAVATVVGLFLVLVRGYFTVIEQFRRGLSRAMDVAARRELAGQAPAAVGVVGSDED